MKRHALCALCLALITACGAAATTVPLESTRRSPAAVGNVELESGSNENMVGTLKVKHLAPPDQLRSDLSVYVTWIRPAGAQDWQNVGQLMVDGDRAGKLRLQTPYRQFDISVSAESSGDVSQPSDVVILEGQVDVGAES